jgi:isoleucyl-tRNA synthetase
MSDWMISKKRFWGLALPIWKFEDGTFFVVGSKKELKELAVEGWEEFEGKSPHRPWIDKVKIKHPESGLIGTRIPDVGNPWLDAGIVPYSTLHYNSDRDYWNKWFPADFVVECLPGQFRNWFYSLLALSTVMEDKAPFKTLLGHAMVKDETGRDMHKSWGNAIWFDDAAEKMGVDVMRWMYANQNPEHNLLFGYAIADEVRKQLITLWNTYSFFVTYANLDGFDPSIEIDKSTLTKSDRWIISKTNKFIKTAEKIYSNYQVFHLMSEATIFLDKLSNWYIRRNRRRFWKSENDSDKTAAYSTLYQILINFVKVMAPVVPFVSDKIYTNLISGRNKSEVDSVHLCDFPSVGEADIDEEIINEIDTVIQIVSLSRSARNKANIKIRQPLAELAVYADDNIQNITKNNQNEILEELNIKTLKFVVNESDLVQYNVKPDFPTLGKKYGKDISRITAYLNDVDNEKLVQIVKSGKSLIIPGTEGELEILPDELILEEIPVKGYGISSGKNIIVGVCTEISEELKQEGLVRDLIRQVQNLRKDSGLKVEDRIEIEINGSTELNNAVESYESYFMNEVLGVKLDMGNSITFKFNGSVTIAGEKINIGISPLN